jgi:hypothetical protein
VIRRPEGIQLRHHFRQLLLHRLFFRLTQRNSNLHSQRFADPET